MIANCREMNLVVMVVRPITGFLWNRLIRSTVGKNAEALIGLKDGSFISTYTARSEYVLYRWNDVFDNAEKIRSMVDRLRFQVECFNEALPYEAGQSYGDRAASQVRVIYRIS